MENKIEKTCLDFLSKVNDDELFDLVNVHKLETIPNGHIIRKLIDASYGDKVPFGLALPSVYPFIAEECYKRMKTYKDFGSASDVAKMSKF